MEVSCPILFFCWLAQFTYFCKIDARISLLVHRKNIAFRFWFHWCKHLLSLTVKISTLLRTNTNCCYWNHEWNFPVDLLFFCSMVWRHAVIPFHFNFQDQTPVFCASVLDSLAVELKGSKDFAKLYSGIAILGYIASLLEAINARAFTHLLTLLGHRYPKVWDLAFDLYSVWTLFRWLATQWIEIYVVSRSQIRKASAEQVYIVLLQNGNLVPEDKMEKALEIISETCWDGDVEATKLQKLELYEMAGVELGLLVKPRDKLPNKDSEKEPATNDENASYSSLVGSTGFWFISPHPSSRFTEVRFLRFFSWSEDSLTFGVVQFD